MFVLGALAEPWRRGSDVYDRLKRAGILAYAVSTGASLRDAESSFIVYVRCYIYI